MIFVFAGLQYGQLLISGQCLGMTAWVCQGWEKTDLICIQPATFCKSWNLLSYSCPRASASLPASFTNKSKVPPPRPAAEGCFRVDGWSASKALALGLSSLLGNWFSGSKPPPPWPKLGTLSFCDPTESQIKLVPTGHPWLSALSHFLAAHKERVCQPLPS